MKYIMLISVSFCLPGCVTPITLLHQDKHNPTQTEAKNSFSDADKNNIKVNSFFWGLLNSKTYTDIDGMCLNKYSIKITRSFLQVLTSLVTLGIYTPALIQITCDSHIQDEKSEFNNFEEELNLK